MPERVRQSCRGVADGGRRVETRGARPRHETGRRRAVPEAGAPVAKRSRADTASGPRSTLPGTTASAPNRPRAGGARRRGTVGPGFRVSAPGGWADRQARPASWRPASWRPADAPGGRAGRIVHDRDKPSKYKSDTTDGLGASRSEVSPVESLYMDFRDLRAPTLGRPPLEHDLRLSDGPEPSRDVVRSHGTSGVEMTLAIDRRGSQVFDDVRGPRPGAGSCERSPSGTARPSSSRAGQAHRSDRFPRSDPTTGRTIRAATGCLRADGDGRASGVIVRAAGTRLLPPSSPKRQA